MRFAHIANVFVLIGIAFVSGCASRPQLSETDLMLAEKRGDLPQLHDRLMAEKSAGGIGNAFGKKELQADINKVAKRLSGNLARLHQAEIQKQRLPMGLIPETAFPALHSQLQAMQRWDLDHFKQLTQALEQESQKSKTAIATLQAQADASKDVVKKLSLLEQQAQIAGPGSSAILALPNVRTQICDELATSIQQLIEAKQFDTALQQTTPLKQLDPKRKGVDLLVLKAQAGILLVSNQPLQDEKQIESAYQGYQKLAGHPEFPATRSILAPLAQDLANYYSAMGSSSIGEDKYLEARQWFLRARLIRQQQAESNSNNAEEGKLAERLFVLAEQADQKQQWGLALGYLSVVEEFAPDYPNLRKLLREHAEKVYDRALKRVTTAVFTGNTPEHSKVGNAVSSKISQFLFQNLTSDIRLVEREQLQAVLREQEISAMQNRAGGILLASADFLIQGSILDASIETIDKASKKTERVPTGTQTVPNPAFAEWQKKAKTGDGDPVPAEMITVPKMEDVAINVTVHRKVGVLSVAYRIVDATTAKVLQTDTVTEKITATGESNEGVKLGDFSVPFKIAELPADGEMYDKLAITISQKIGSQLVSILKDPEDRYASESKRLHGEENFSVATERMADAMIISRHKNKDTTALAAQLRVLSLHARP